MDIILEKNKLKGAMLKEHEEYLDLVLKKLTFRDLAEVILYKEKGDAEATKLINWINARNVIFDGFIPQFNSISTAEDLLMFHATIPDIKMQYYILDNSYGYDFYARGETT